MLVALAKMKHGGGLSILPFRGRPGGANYFAGSRRCLSGVNTKSRSRLGISGTLPCCETGVFTVGQVRASIPHAEHYRLLGLARPGRRRDAPDNQNPVGVTVAAGVAGAASMLGEPVAVSTGVIDAKGRRCIGHGTLQSTRHSVAGK
jgi:hypothetical protein